MKRNQRAETKSETTSMTTVIVKLENISASIGELKTSTKSFQEEIKDLRERQIRTEEKLDNMGARINSFEQELKSIKHTYIAQ